MHHLLYEPIDLLELWILTLYVGPPLLDLFDPLFRERRGVTGGRIVVVVKCIF